MSSGMKELSTKPYLVEVHTHTLQLEIAGAIVTASMSAESGSRAGRWRYVHTGRIKSVLTRDGLPERGTNLVTLGYHVSTAARKLCSGSSENLHTGRSGCEESHAC